MNNKQNNKTLIIILGVVFVALIIGVIAIFLNTQKSKTDNSGINQSLSSSSISIQSAASVSGITRQNENQSSLPARELPQPQLPDISQIQPDIIIP